MMSPQLQVHATPANVVFTSNPPPSNQADMAQTLNKPASEPDVREAVWESAATENPSQVNSMAEIQSQKTMQHRQKPLKKRKKRISLTN